MERVKDHPTGPLYAPPSLKGTLGIPADSGVLNWEGAAVDLETGLFYIPSATSLGIFRVTKPDRARSDLDYVTAWFSPGPHDLGIQGLPLTKPPYSHVTPINWNTGEHQWMKPHGDGPRTHPLLKDLDLRPLGEPNHSGSGGGRLLTKTLLFVHQRFSSEGLRMSVFDKATGELLTTRCRTAAQFSARKSRPQFAQRQTVHPRLHGWSSDDGMIFWLDGQQTFKGDRVGSAIGPASAQRNE